MKDLPTTAPRGVFNTLVEAFWRRVDKVIGSDGATALAVRAARAETIVRVYYLYLMALSYGRIGTASGYLGKDKLVEPSLGLALTSWVPLGFWWQIAVGLAFLMLVASLLAATIPRWRIPRIVAVGSFVLLEAMTFDQDGKISHAAHPWVWAGIAFCFLPELKIGSRERCREYLANFFGAQLLVCLLYFCSGLSKVIGIAYDWSSGVTWLNPEALPLVLAANWAKWRALEYFPAGAFFVLNPWAAWLSNVGVLFLELGVLAAVFRPRLHRPWALGILIMHAMIWLTMVIQFRQSAFAVGLILFASPFAPARLELKEILLDLPGVRLVRQWLRTRRGKGADESLQGEQASAPWMPPSRVMRLWIPVVVVAYLFVAFGNLDKSGGSDEEIYPISAMPMFMRIPSSEKNVRKLARLRARLNRARGEPVDSTLVIPGD